MNKRIFRLLLSTIFILLSTAIMVGAQQNMVPAWKLPAPGQIYRFGTPLAPNRGGMNGFSPGGSPLQFDFKRVAQAVKLSVVSISAIKDTMIPSPAVSPGNAGFVAPFDGTETMESIGSGVIIDGEGYILTNWHVIAQARSIHVTLQGNPGNVHEARVAMKNAAMDLAVLQIVPNERLQAARLGNSDTVKLGDWVMAVGSAFGFEQTITAGIISGRGRNLTIGGRMYRDLFQTDCSINRGNSGGPLVNMHGEVIAINTAIYAPTGVSTGVGFAIPINQVISIMNLQIRQAPIGFRPAQSARPIGFMPFSALTNQWGQSMLNAANTAPVNSGSSNNIVLVAGRPVDTGWLGFSMFPKDGGLVVVDVLQDSPAQMQGIKSGDLIVACNGRKVSDMLSFDGIVDKTRPGERICLALIRDGKRGLFYLRTGRQP